MEEKIITINCHGSLEEIISSLKDIVCQIEDAKEKNEFSEFFDGKRFESYSRNVVATVLK